MAKLRPNAAELSVCWHLQDNSGEQKPGKSGLAMMEAQWNDFRAHADAANEAVQAAGKVPASTCKPWMRELSRGS